MKHLQQISFLSPSSRRTFAFGVRKRMGPQNRLYYQWLDENIIHVPGENPSKRKSYTD